MIELHKGTHQLSKGTPVGCACVHAWGLPVDQSGGGPVQGIQITWLIVTEMIEDLHLDPWSLIDPGAIAGHRGTLPIPRFSPIPII